MGTLHSAFRQRFVYGSAVFALSVRSSRRVAPVKMTGLFWTTTLKLMCSRHLECSNSYFWLHHCDIFFYLILSTDSWYLCETTTNQTTCPFSKKTPNYLGQWPPLLLIAVQHTAGIMQSCALLTRTPVQSVLHLFISFVFLVYVHEPPCSMKSFKLKHEACIITELFIYDVY